MWSRREGWNSRTPVPLLRALLVFCLFAGTSFALAAQDSRPTVEIPHEGFVLTLTADVLQAETDETLIAEGDVVATYQDATLRTNHLRYDPKTSLLIIEGSFEIVRQTNWLKGSRAELDIEAGTGIIYDASGYTDEELYLSAKILRKIGPDLYIAEDGYVTACEERVPKWSFTVKRARIDVSSTARLKNTLFRVKEIPVFYFPYLLLPTGGKERSSGLMLPTIGNSSNKGRRFSQRVYLVLGRSADLMVQGDYYSLRGWGGGATFRARPNQRTILDLSGEFVDDRLGRGGANIFGLAQTTFDNGFRAVADFNLVTSFLFRQTFSDNFFTATRPFEDSRFFLTNHFQGGAFNVLLGRQETIFPGKNAVIQSLPTVNFKFIGRQLGSTGLHFDFDTSLSGVSRDDSQIETPALSQRIDFHPRIYFSLPIAQGLRLSPRLGVRETFYSDSLATSEGDVKVVGRSVHRNYADFGIDLKGWGLSRVWGDAGGRRWKHLIEPVAGYRYITGINNFDEIVRFDEMDAIADTNEVEYALVNRFYTKDSPSAMPREWLSVKIGQKYFFDPTFGGALEEGAINQFFPLNTLTGLPYATRERDFSPITTLIRFNPSRRSSFDVRGDFDSDTGRFTTFSVTGFYRRDLVSFATTYFLSEDLVQGLGESNQIQGHIGLGNFSRGISAFVGASYDAQETRLLNHLARVSYFWDCCGISGELSGFNLSTRDERQIRFSFFLKGIGSFGNLRRPDNVF